MNTLISFILAIGTAWAGPATNASVELKIQKAPGDFIRNVGRQCLSAPSAKITMSRGGIQIEDEAGCAADLKRAAGAWDLNADQGVMAAHVPAPLKSEVKKTIASRFSENQNQILMDTLSCPCLVFFGPKSGEAARLAVALGSRGLRR